MKAAPVKAQRRTVRLPAGDVSYLEWAPTTGHGPAIVLLHGGGLDNAELSWGELGPALARSGLRGVIRDPRRRPPQLLDAIMAAAGDGTGLRVFGQWQRDQFGWRRLRTDYTSQLGAFPCPALVIHGARDAAVPVAYAARLMPAARLVIAGDAAHWVQRDQPGLVRDAVVDFLRALG